MNVHRTGPSSARRVLAEAARRALAAIGAVALCAWILGALGAMDFHICAKAPEGACKKVQQ